MGKVRTGLAVSLDGFISGPNDGAAAPMGDGGERLLAWYAGGDTEYRLPGTDMVFRVSAPTAEFLRQTRNDRGVGVWSTDLRPHQWVGWQTPLGCAGLCCEQLGPTRVGLRRIAVHVRHRGTGKRPSAGASGCRRQGRRCGRREHRAAVPQGGTPRRDTPGPGARPARGRRPIVRPPRHRADRPGAHEGDRGRWGDASYLPRRKVK
jgi:hypothetical protein